MLDEPGNTRVDTLPKGFAAIVQSTLHKIRRDTGMWKRLSEWLHRTWLMLNKSAYERRAEKARARFWLEVREGQREAEIAIRS